MTYNPEKRRQQYLRDKAKGKPQKYYQDKIAKDPMYNRKAHIRRMAKNEQWQTERGRKNNQNDWLKLVEYIKESDKEAEALAKELAEAWTLYRHTTKTKSNKKVYRPRMTNRVLTEQEIRELNDEALSLGLSTETEVVKSSVKYQGEMGRIDDKRDEKRVDIYTMQPKGEITEVPAVERAEIKMDTFEDVVNALNHLRQKETKPGLYD